MLDEYPDTVELVIRPFPSTHSQSSLLAASAVLAAHAQRRFWDFRDQLFHSEGPVSTTDLHDIAEQVGIDRPRFFRDLSSTVIQRLLTRCLNDGIHQGVRATPTVFVNQTPITSLRINDLRQAIQQAAAQ